MTGHMEKYQAILLDYPDVTLHNTTTLNPATLLTDMKENAALQHDYLEIIDQVNSSRLDLLDQPWRHLTGSCAQTGAASWTTANDESGMQQASQTR